MNFELVRKEGFKVSGLSVELSSSQSENSKIIQSHWKKFNSELRNRKIVPGQNWTKYGVTRKVDGRYSYLTAIASKLAISGFEIEEIRSGKYLLFGHVGSMDLMKATISDIYRVTIPNSNYYIDENRIIIHYEQYDRRFNWGKPGSVIDIFVPIEGNT